MQQVNRLDPESCGMNEYERLTNLWNQTNNIRLRRQMRQNEINNTDGYHTGNRIHHVRSIQVPSSEIWNDLFRYENPMNPALRAYAQESIRYVEDETNTLRFAGQMEVSLIMQENYRPGVHVAVFIIQLSPHRRFHDGHVIQKEFAEGSRTQSVINRLFDPNEHAVVSQVTEYSILEYLADDDEMRDLLHTCFLDPDFSTVRYSWIQMDNDGGGEDDSGYYVMDQNAADDHMIHQFEDPEAADDADDAAAMPDLVEDEEENHVRIPPPPPANNDIRALFNFYYNQYNEIEPPRRNIIQYYYNEEDDHSDDDEEVYAQG